MPKQKTSPSMGRSLDEFRAAHDKGYIVPQKIREALEKLGETWVYESEFLKLAGLSTTDLATYREEFADFVVIADRSSKRRVWCGTLEFAANLREMVT